MGPPDCGVCGTRMKPLFLPGSFYCPKEEEHKAMAELAWSEEERRTDPLPMWGAHGITVTWAPSPSPDPSPTCQCKVQNYQRFLYFDKALGDYRCRACHLPV